MIIVSAKNMASISILLVGIIALLYGMENSSDRVVNLGIGAILLSLVIYALRGGIFVEKHFVRALVAPILDDMRSLVRDLNVEGNAVFIPPYENLPEGGLFIPFYKDFSLDLRKLSNGATLLSKTGNEREMGILLHPIGLELVKLFEDHMEEKFGVGDISRVESVVSSVLSYANLIDNIKIVRDSSELIISIIHKKESICNHDTTCSKIPCPICSSVIESLSREIGEILAIDRIKVGGSDREVMITLKVVEGNRPWM